MANTISGPGYSYQNKVMSILNPTTGERRYILANDTAWGAGTYQRAGFTQLEGVVQPGTPQAAAAARQLGNPGAEFFGGSIGLQQSRVMPGSPGSPQMNVLPGNGGLSNSRTLNVLGQSMSRDDLVQVRRGNEGIIQVSRGAYEDTYKPAGFQMIGQPVQTSAFSGTSSQQNQFAQSAQNGLTGVYGELYNALETQLNELQRRGMAINPNVEITPERMAEFMRQAEGEINPYYQSQLKLARESFMRSIGYSSEDLALQERDLERKFRQGNQQIGEQSAEQGFALSGGRQRQEGEFADETQRAITKGRRQLQFQAGEAAGQFAQRYGGGMYNPMLGDAPTASAGEKGFGRTPGSRALYELDPDVYSGLVGSEEYARRAAVSRRSSELEGLARESDALSQMRQLVF